MYIFSVRANANKSTEAVGLGYTPEGLDQNPVYFEILQEAAFRSQPIFNLSEWIIHRAHRRYGLFVTDEKVSTRTLRKSVSLQISQNYTNSEHKEHVRVSHGLKFVENENVTAAWIELLKSGYAYDESVLDETGVGIFPGKDLSFFARNLRTPSEKLCNEFAAWGHLIDAGSTIRKVLYQKWSKNRIVDRPLPEPYVYDLINIGREVLAQLSTPMSVNFSRAILAKTPLDIGLLNHTGGLYIELLNDLDSLLIADQAFLLGSWLAKARALVSQDHNISDCHDTIIGDLDCADFMEWNARSQITSWYPTTSATASTSGKYEFLQFLKQSIKGFRGSREIYYYSIHAVL